MLERIARIAAAASALAVCVLAVLVGWTPDDVLEAQIQRDARNSAELVMAAEDTPLTEAQKAQIAAEEKAKMEAENAAKAEAERVAAEEAAAEAEAAALADAGVEAVYDDAGTAYYDGGDGYYYGGGYRVSYDELYNPDGPSRLMPGWYGDADSGYVETYYSENVTGRHHLADNWTVDDEGFYHDENGRYVIGVNGSLQDEMPYGTVVMTGKGEAAVYDYDDGSGPENVHDFYTNW